MCSNEEPREAKEVLIYIRLFVSFFYTAESLKGSNNFKQCRSSIYRRKVDIRKEF